MGMAASQARLLSITARLSNNENTGQSISYAKQRLADQTQQITNEYNEALDTTKLTVLTGFNGAQANYEDISYNLITGLQMATSTKQYVVTDNKGKVLVTEKIADAYTKSHGDYNRFLAELGLSQSDLYVNSQSQDETLLKEAETQIHEAWDKYFETVGINLTLESDEDYNEHQKTNKPAFIFVETQYSDEELEKLRSLGFEDVSEYHLGTGYVAYKTEDEDDNGNPIYAPINYDGSTKESRDLYDYAMAITEAFYRNGSDYNVTYEMGAVKDASNMDNIAEIKYYKNIFNKIQQSGYFTYTDTPAKSADATIKDNYLYSQATKGTGKVVKNPLQDNYTFEAQLRNGTLKLEYYSTTDKNFKATTISEDNCIQEVPDERAIAKAEAKYNQDMADLENKDKKFDLDLRRLDTEHNALQTEYDAVKNVVDKNVESSFKIFS